MMSILKTLLYMFFCLCFGVLSICFIYQVSNFYITKKNGFIRLLASHPVRFEHILDLTYNSYYIAGVTNKKIYLGNLITTGKLLVANSALTDTQFISLNIPTNKRIAWGMLRTTIDSPLLYVSEGLLPSIFIGNSDSLHANLVDSHCAQFENLIPISNNSFITRHIDPEKKENILAKEYISLNKSVIGKGILTKQQDGIFSTDGVLKYNSVEAKLFYIYFYRNEFICLDTNLNVLYKAHTIDTTKTAKLKIASVYSDGTITMGAPPVVVNKTCFYTGKWLFISSGLASNNQSKNIFDDEAVIDVYSAINGLYQLSFYVPNFKGSKPQEFAFYDKTKTLYVRYDHYLLSYHINLSL